MQQIKEHRKYPRYKFSGNDGIVILTPDIQKVKMVDISYNGICFELLHKPKAPLTRGDRAKLILRDNNTNMVLKTMFTVMRADNDSLIVGGKFDKESDSKVLVIIEYLKNNIIHEMVSGNIFEQPHCSRIPSNNANTTLKQ